MPVGPSDSRRALLIAAAGLIGAVGLVVLIIVATNAGGSRTSGDASFGDLGVDTALGLQERDGVPTCFNDPADGSRPICVWHEGDVDEEGWVAYDAQTGGCPLAFDVDSEVFTACDGTEYPFTGEGLPQYPVSVRDGRLVIALDGEPDDDPVGETTTTSTIVISGEPQG